MFSARHFPPSSASVQYFLGRSLRNTINATKSAWTTYNKGLDFYPRFTAMATGAFLWGFGDIVVQYKIDKVDVFEWSRLYGSVAFGAIVTGFCAFYWYNAIHWIVYDYLRLAPKTFVFILAKVFLELGVFAPTSLVAFWFFMGKAGGQSSRDIIDHMKENNKYIESLKIDWLLWLPVDVLNFGLIPVKYQILAVNAGCLIEAVVLGKIEADACRREHEAEEHEKALVKKKLAEILDGKRTRCVKTDVNLFPASSKLALD